MITINNKPLAVDSVFSGGEVRIQLPKFDFEPAAFNVKASLANSDEIMKLIMVKEALDYYFPVTPKNLTCWYLPYARQDRRCNEGEAFSSKTFIEMLDRLNFDYICVADVHSEVVIRMLRRRVRSVMELTPCDILPRYLLRSKDSVTIIAPDKGAEKRAFLVQSQLENYIKADLCIAAKSRAPDTGYITETAILSGEEHLSNRDLVIVDDICDGGLTFILLAKKLLEYRPKSLTLYVTHGIFSKGLEPLFGAGFTEIITTDSICTLTHPKLKVINL